MRSGRRGSREFALQGLYQWQLSGAEPATIEAQLAAAKGFDKSDRAYFSQLLAGAVQEADELRRALEPFLDRKFEALSPIERGIMMIGGYELRHCIDVPYRVIINEAVELAKSYGGADGFRYVNGVLDKLAAALRPDEIARRRPPVDRENG
jgi:transcription antitermination protein NusB